DEIEAADPGEAEEAELVARRERLRHAEALRAAALGAAEALAPDDGPGVAGLAGGAVAALEAVASVDAELDGLAERARGVAYEAADVAGELRQLGEGIDGDAAELETVEERLG